MSASPTEQKSWIAKSPGVSGGDACIRATRHSVAGLVQWRRLGLSDREILRHHPDLSPADLAMAWEYYRVNGVEIDQAIEQGEDA